MQPEPALIVTPRLALRDFKPDDAGFIVELLNDPGWLRHSITGPDNRASQRVLEAIGLHLQRRLRLDGHTEDSLLYAADAPR